MEKQEMYFKIYQDKDSTDYNYYIDTRKQVIDNLLDMWMLDHIEHGEPMPVIEPFMMTEEEFLQLPEFDGY